MTTPWSMTHCNSSPDTLTRLQLCSAVAKLTETRLATDDITIVALRREG